MQEKFLLFEVAFAEKNPPYQSEGKSVSKATKFIHIKVGSKRVRNGKKTLMLHLP